MIFTEGERNENAMGRFCFNWWRLGVRIFCQVNKYLVAFPIVFFFVAAVVVPDVAYWSVE